MKGKTFVLSGPSGAGKSTLIKGARNRIDNLGYSISHTTRNPRPNEKDGVDYFFISKNTFKDMIEKDAFVEWAHVYDDYYGTSYLSLENELKAGFDIILDIDIQGAKNIKGKIDDCLLIFILPTSTEILKKRLQTRATDTTAAIEKRIKQVNNELSNCRWYDYLIINDDLEKATKELEAIIIADRCSNERSLSEIEVKFGI